MSNYVTINRSEALTEVLNKYQSQIVICLFLSSNAQEIARLLAFMNQQVKLYQSIYFCVIRSDKTFIHCEYVNVEMDKIYMEAFRNHSSLGKLYTIDETSLARFIQSLSAESNTPSMNQYFQIFHKLYSMGALNMNIPFEQSDYTSVTLENGDIITPLGDNRYGLQKYNALN